MPRVLPLTKTDFLRGTLSASSRTLRQFHRKTSGEPSDFHSRDIAALRGNWWFIQAQLEELEAAFSRQFCRKLRLAGKHREEEEPRVYGLISSILGCVISSTFGSLALGRLLTTDALAELFSAGRLGASMSLAELWAVPPIVKLVLIEKLAHTVSTLPVDPGQFDPDHRECEMHCILECLHSLERIRWRYLIESVSTVHHILSDDPAGVYPRMEFESRDLYRHTVEDLAAEAGLEEEHVADLAVALAREAHEAGAGEKESHVGHYLVGAGLPCLRSRGGLRRSLPTRFREPAYRFPNLFYIGGAVALTASLTAVLARLIGPMPWWWLALLMLASSQPAIAALSIVLSLVLPPRRMPRLDFSKGIPDEYRTFVVVPTLLLSRLELERVLERLEIHYLANRDPNLLFGLLADFPDSASPTGCDQALLEACASGIRHLNQRYAAERESRFYVFHRKPQWNESQQKWIGRERKRGKLEDFNRLLLGVEDAFELKIGDLSKLSSIRYVITLDSDTQLPRDTAWKLIGSLAHPLQKPWIDTDSNTVREGYAILQPRASVSMESAERSRFAQILSGQTGFDSYATATSNAYQDLYGQASYTGKGIYDLRAFHAVLDRRFPDNSLLSHDLIEGEHVRAGLVTDLEEIEDFPSNYESYSLRKHRWARGDWQLLPWLRSWVPDGRGRRIRNPLSFLSRWKLIDNLRRSLFEIALLMTLLAGWILSRRPSSVVAVAAVLLLFAAYADFAAMLFRLPPVRFWRGHLRERAAEFQRAHFEALLFLVSLPHQALLMTDAILRTLIRRFVTGRNLLEWQCMAQTEAGAARSIRGFRSLVASTAIPVSFMVCFGRRLTWPPVLVMLLWIASPWVMKLVHGRQLRAWREPPNDVQFLRDIALRTWRYFSDFSRREDHWLVPDNIQEEPDSIARCASPTNLGLQLASNIAAFDFGYLTHQEIAIRSDDILGTLLQLETYRGHVYNWYDTQTLMPLAPRYVSTVDSGNLAAALITLKQACEGMHKQRLVDMKLLEGLRDHCVRLRKSLPPSARNAPTMSSIANLIRLLGAHPANLFSWHSVLREAISAIQDLNQFLAAARRRLERHDPEHVGELSYWQNTLNRRARSALEGLCELAPWLTDRYEVELQACVNTQAGQDLMAALVRNPELHELPSGYDSIEISIAQLLASPDLLPGKFRDLLLQLIEDVRRARSRARTLLESFSRQAGIASRFVHEMDFAFLFDSDRDLLHIGYNADTGRLDDCYYNLLASEARTAVFLAVAKGDAPGRTWFRLGRKATSFGGHSTLLSWSGTMFEYLMPSLFMKTFKPTLLGKSLSGVVQAQRLYARELSVPWGISESSCSSRNHELRYDYHAFGVPGVSLRRLQSTNIVVAPYASMLALMIDRRSAAENLRYMASRGWTGRYGFFEAVDFQVEGSGKLRRPTVVRSFMAHHQGMGLLALCNAVLDYPMQKRFHAEPIVAATELLLQERIPCQIWAY